MFQVMHGLSYNRAIKNWTRRSRFCNSSRLYRRIRLKSDYAEAFTCRGAVKVNLKDYNGANSDFQTALKLAEQQGNAELKAFIEEKLQELNDSTP